MPYKINESDELSIAILQEIALRGNETKSFKDFYYNSENLPKMASYLRTWRRLELLLVKELGYVRKVPSPNALNQYVYYLTVEGQYYLDRFVYELDVSREDIRGELEDLDKRWVK